MNERTVRHESPPRYESSTPLPRHPLRSHEPAPAQASRAVRPAPCEPARRTERDPDVMAGGGDGYWFRQWVDGPHDSTQDDTAGTGSLSGLASLEGSDEEAFVDQLTPRLQATLDQQLDLLLHLPHLGRIRVCAQRSRGACGWDIGLSSEDARTQARLSSRTARLEDALTQGLGQPVTVRVTREKEDT
ncbi:hypothetical protein SAMN03159488_02481 [Pseudomonas sp. NFIX10]|uniref:type III secretion protein n=1 Tax=unclassified Pseudomonas TaxID=196821 RepID=UPI0008E4C72B|nr:MULTISPECIES: type III secretion protein [unclassified Pseudomonas]SFB22724.1 hypothetical protein SAMN03159488_02481 [Pseudomonas sp. NFIX10]SFF10893.1 hypothetical protein SAMN03159367_03128 [Pseudomonas sp. NFACC06-1]